MARGAHPALVKKSEAGSITLPSDSRGTDPYRLAAAVYERLLRPGHQAPFSIDRLVAENGELVFSGSRLASGFDNQVMTDIFRFGHAGKLEVEDGLQLIRRSPQQPVVARVFTGAAGASEVQLTTDGQNGARWLAPGTIEELDWSPDGSRLLMLVSGEISGNSGIRGAKVRVTLHDGPAWLPHVETSSDHHRWRSLWIWSIDRDSPDRLSNPGFNPWEATWYGNDKLLVVASAGVEEGSWYRSALWCLPAAGAPGRILRKPENQLGCIAASKDGRHIAWVEGACSGRSGVCGSIVRPELSGECATVDTRGVDVTHLVWRNGHLLVYSGLRGLETVVGECCWNTGSTREIWRSTSETISGWLPSATLTPENEVLIVAESYQQGPAVLSLGADGPKLRLSCSPSATKDFGTIRPVSWAAPDGLEIQGWLIEPPQDIAKPGNGWPLLVDIHGGPISAHRNRWAANLRAAPILASRGWAVLLPNPRGSAGRGQTFARSVIGDMGGADSVDITSGIDWLAQQGLVDPERVVITGNSYGGFMCGVLVTRSPRFAAAIPICPVANWTSQHFASHIGWFDQAFLKASPHNPDGPYLDLSPVFHSLNVTTPTLVLGGQLDRDTPDTQAVEMYNAIREAGAQCALCIYPEEGHGLFGMPAYMDSAARVSAWAEKYT